MIDFKIGRYRRPFLLDFSIGLFVYLPICLRSAAARSAAGLVSAFATNTPLACNYYLQFPFSIDF